MHTCLAEQLYVENDFICGSAGIPALLCGSQPEIISTTQRQVPEEREQNGLPLGVNECRAAAFQDFDYFP